MEEGDQLVLFEIKNRWEELLWWSFGLILGFADAVDYEDGDGGIWDG